MHAMHRSHNRIGRDERLMREHHDTETQLLRRERCVVQEGRVIRRPRFAAWWTQQRDKQRNPPRRRHRAEHDECPRDARVGQNRPASDEPGEQCNRRDTASHVVENFPPRYRRERIDRATVVARHLIAQPGRKLPVAPNPPVQAARRGEVAHWIIVEYFDVGDEARARERPLDQIVAQQCVLGEAPRGRALEHRDFVDPFARKRPFAEQILVDIRHRGRVRVHTRMPREDRRIGRTVRAGERHAHSRLENAVSLHDTSGALVEHGAVEWMRHRADERDRGVARQDGIRVERHDIAHAAQPRRVALDRRERAVVLPEHIVVELHQLAAFALPPHPDTVGRVQTPRAMKDVEGRTRLARVQRVRRVECAHTLHCRGHDGVIARFHFGVCVEKIAEQRESDFRITIRQILRLDMIERLLDRLRAAEQNGYDDDSAVLGRQAVLEGHSRETVGGQQQRHELVDGRDRHVGGRQKREQHRAQHADAKGTVEWIEQERKCAGHSHAERGEIAQARRVLHGAIQTLTHAGAQPKRCLERASPVVDKVVAHVRGACAAAGRSLRYCGGLDGSFGHLLFRDVRAPREVLHHVPIAVARLERHPGVHATRIATQHGFRGARRLDKLGPVDDPDFTQAGDAVGHHELREREMLCRALHGLFDAHHLVGDPLLEPEQWREIRAPAADLLEKPGQERRCERRGMVDQVFEHPGERLASRVLRSEQASDPPIGFLRVC